MNKAKRQKILDAGYRITDTKTFLGLSNSEAAVIELKITLLQRVHAAWATSGTAQVTASDTILALMRKLFQLGVTPKELGKTIAQAEWAASVH